MVGEVYHRKWKYAKLSLINAQEAPVAVASPKGHVTAVMGVALSRDGKFLVTACADKTAQVWDLNNKTQLFTLEHPDGVSAVALSNDGTCIITGCDDCLVRGWELQSGKELFCLESHTGLVLCVAVSNDSKRFASGSDDDTARVWDMESKKELLKLEGGTGAVGCVNFSRDNKFIATGTEGVSSPKSCANGFTEPRGFTCVWDLVSGEKKHMFPGHTAAFTRSSKRIAVGGDTGSVVVYKVESGEKIFEVKHPKFSDECFFTSIVFHRDGKLMVTGNNDRTIQIWDMVSRKFIRTLEGHSGPVMSVAVI